VARRVMALPEAQVMERRAAAVAGQRGLVAVAQIIQAHAALDVLILFQGRQ
jgi:hypothetical protein